MKKVKEGPLSMQLRGKSYVLLFQKSAFASPKIHFDKVKNNMAMPFLERKIMKNINDTKNCI